MCCIQIILRINNGQHRNEEKMDHQTDHIIPLDFSEEMRNSYRDYAVSVIIARALPDVRDGLKPVQRRILYAMRELGLDPKKPHRKSARIVGDTMGKYHPHGDSSIYDALVHMTEDYSLQLPLIDGHGNFGSIDGDGAAAMRYTEARLSEGGMALLEHLDENLVDFEPNFDDSEQEPSVLPAMLPNLLINGTTGIAVGMATNIPPHNINEVIDGCIAYIDNPSISCEALRKYIPGPDFPTGGIIINSKDLSSIYETGEGRIKVRAKTEIEAGEYGKKNIIISEIPYTIAGNKSKLVESLSTLMKDKVFDEISDVRDESSKEGIRIVIEVKKDRDINNLLNGLYKKTALEDTYTINLLAVRKKQPYLFSLKSLVQEFISFQQELYTKEYQHLLEKANRRLELVDGLMRATNIIDLIIEILRGSSSIKQAKECLTKGCTNEISFKSKQSEKIAKTLNFTERQADAILTMQLSKLIGLEVLKLKEEHQTLLDSIQNYQKILGDPKELFKIIKGALRNYKKRFGHIRRTQLADLETTDYIEEFKIEDIYVLIDKFGYTKALDAAAYSRTAKENLQEYVQTIRMKNTDKLCLFTEEGMMYQIKASAIPRCRLKEKGTLIHNLCKIGQETILLYTCLEELFESSLLFHTKNGFIKRVSGIEFETSRSVINSTKLDSGDRLVSIIMLSAKEILEQEQKVILLTKKGLTLGFALSEVVELKKTGRGVKAITLVEGDEVVFTIVLPSLEESFEYNGKRLSAKKIRMRKRGVEGQKVTLT